ncbi:porphobilinogen deaminase [Clarireedia jacksonii]
MATHEQLESTSSRPILDPTTSVQEKPPKEAAPLRALSHQAEREAHDEKASSAQNTIHIGTRKSALAMVQTEWVKASLQKSHPHLEFEIHAMSTMGDKNQTTALHDFGAKSLWTHELEELLLSRKLDVVVHCLKDMPTQLPPSCKIGCITEREDPRDALVMKKGSSYKSLAELPEGSVVGTSSVRRSAQVKKHYPHLKFKDVRGNIGTRLSKLDAEDAAAGLLRMDWGERITQYLDSKTEGGGLLHAVGQGALALEMREGDERITEIISTLEDRAVMLAGLAERSLMRTLEGGCSVPIGVETTWIEKGKLLMKAIVVSLDGAESVEAERLEEVLTPKDSDEFGWQLAQDLVSKGAAKILEAINLNRSIIKDGNNA